MRWVGVGIATAGIWMAAAIVTYVLAPYIDALSIEDAANRVFALLSPLLVAAGATLLLLIFLPNEDRTDVD